MHMPKVSIVIPIYNGELTIRRCIDSVLSQEYKDFEVVIIDDGSIDKSLEICSKYAEKDNRIILFSQNNKGVSAARNEGIRKANGEYITFVDCDDWIEPNMLTKMLCIAEKENVDIVYMNFYYELENSQHIGRLSPDYLRKKDIHSFPLAILLPEASYFYDHVKQDHDILGAACSKLFRKKLFFNDIWFDENLSIAEDCLFNLNCYLKASDIFIDSTPVYHYSIHANSANHKMRTNIIKQGEMFYRSYIEFSKQLDFSLRNTFKELVKYRCYYELITRYIDHTDNKCSFKEKHKLLSNFMQHPIYTYTGEIPAFLNCFKKIEVLFLKHRLYLGLLVMNKIRMTIKPKLNHLFRLLYNDICLLGNI